MSQIPVNKQVKLEERVKYTKKYWGVINNSRSERKIAPISYNMGVHY